MALIQELIDITRKDNFEIVRDEIAAIIVAEVANQKAQAVAQGEDPDPYDLKVYLERSNPWERYQRSDTDQTPIVNVYYDSDVTDLGSSNLIDRQKMDGVFVIDCYGRGISRSDGAGGHIAGDEEAALLAQRTMRLVRAYLFAGVHEDLGLTGVVWRRYLQSREVLHQEDTARAAQQIVAARMRLAVEYNEVSPQYIAENLELLSVQLRREALDGFLYFQRDFDYTP
jgi:hypothetical protein